MRLVKAVLLCSVSPTRLTVVENQTLLKELVVLENGSFLSGSSVNNDASGDAIYRGRGPSTVFLQRRNNAQTTGVFRCEIPDASGANQTISMLEYTL